MVQTISDKAVSSGFGRLYANRLGKNLSSSFSRHRHLFEGLEGGYDVERGATCRYVITTWGSGLFEESYE